MIRAEKKQFEMSQLSSRQRAAKLELVDGLTERWEFLLFSWNLGYFQEILELS